MASDKEESKIDNASIYRRVNGDFMVKAYVGADSLGSKLMSQEDKRAYLKMTNDVDKHTFAMSVANKMFKNEVANDVKRQKTHSMKM